MSDRPIQPTPSNGAPGAGLTSVAGTFAYGFYVSFPLEGWVL
jgi:hypothetical protein